MVGAINRQGISDLGSSTSKACAKCGSEFFRNKQYSDAQWESQRFCSRSCAAKKHDIDLSLISKRYLSGESSVEIARDVGVSDIHLRRLLKKAGVVFRSASEGKKLALSRPDVRNRMRESATGRRLSEGAKEKLRGLVGPLNHNWNSGLTINGGGYLQFTSSPANGVNAGRFLHQVVAEWKYGRKTERGEHIHHVDGNKLNNSPDNLVIMAASDHAKIHKLGESCSGK